MRNNILKLGIIILFCIIIFLVFYFKVYQLANIQFWMVTHDKLMTWIASNYLIAIVIYVTLFSILLGFYMPFFDFSIILSGFLFGWDGMFYCSIIVVLSSYILYVIGKTLFKNIAEKFLLKSKKISNVTSSIRNQENFSVFILRFLPLFPFQIITLLCAIIGIRKKNFLFFSLLGYLPRMAIYVYIGIKLEHFFELGESNVNIWQAIPIKSILIIMLILGLFMIFGYWYMKRGRKNI
ncbi:MAG: VTT domain-containing protein [Fusobacteria bacterium]|nr:VTT domain-containing protein [Fusobacteriota bacterium]